MIETSDDPSPEVQEATAALTEAAVEVAVRLMEDGYATHDAFVLVQLATTKIMRRLHEIEPVFSEIHALLHPDRR